MLIESHGWSLSEEDWIWFTLLIKIEQLLAGIFCEVDLYLDNESPYKLILFKILNE